MTLQQLPQKIHYMLLLLIAFSLPFLNILSSILIILLGINWLFLNSFKEKIRLIRQRKLSWLFIGFFLLHLIGLFYSQNLSEGWKDVQQKLSLLIFPLIIATTTALNIEKLKKIAVSFISGVTAATFICTAFAVVAYIEKGTTSVFFYHNLAGGVNMNAIYLSLYCLLSILFLFFYLYQENTFKSIASIVSVWFLLIVVLLSSKLFIALAFVAVNVFLFAMVFKRNKKRFGIPGLVGCNLIILLLVLQLKPIQNRFSAEAVAPVDVVMQEQYTYDTPFSGYTLRLTFWRFVLEILHEQQSFIFGVGTGDGQDLLDQKYKQRNIFTGDTRRGDTGYLGWNVHNQFFQVLLYFGLVGILFYLAVLFIPFLICLKQKQWLYLFFLILIISISLTESFLETHKGVVFYSFFNSIFAFYYIEKNRFNS